MATKKPRMGALLNATTTQECRTNTNMAKLTSKERKSMSSSEFAEPSKRAYPIPDASHARNALARVSEFGSPAEKAQVRRKVHEKFPNIRMHRSGS